MEISIRNRWVSRLHEESNNNSRSLFKNGCPYGTYVTTVFLLDTSASMAGEGLEQMKTAFKDIINEFSKHPSKTENVSVITFGDDVKILQYYSKDYISISRCVDSIECRGDSKLEAGLIMCLSGIQTVPYSNIGSFHVRTRIVVITDGKPTDLCNENGHEIYQSRGFDEVSNGVIDVAKQLGRGNPIFCIPVGTDPDI
ncbi:uncharacterized protein LOC134272569, partial [Saccostrea cucullata]|uniref:uncharacterized protein LOC134272569 n=1 Tax=Saccostrea cuccullata TaxID=36930 RepID=UPI002ED19180